MNSLVERKNSNKKNESIEEVEYIFEMKNLRTYFFIPEGVVKAVDGVSFKLRKGEIIGLVGESGCGKSITSLSILRLIDKPGKIVGGDIIFKGNNLLSLSEKEMREIRGKKISMIFQDPMTSLNPLLTIGTQMVETVLFHERVKKKEAYERAVGLLNNVGIHSPKDRMNEYPHQFSGGMRQRVMIAMAMLCNPDIIIADEPTTALDVTIQAQILDILRKLVSEFKTSVIFISHDLAVISEMCKRVVLMYAGKVIEKARIRDILDRPRHPYTQGLISSIPNENKKGEKLFNIKGVVPIPINLPVGCTFYDRCDKRLSDICHKVDPGFKNIGKWHSVRCHKYK